MKKELDKTENGATGLSMKKDVNDLIREAGGKAFNRLVSEALSPESPVPEVNQAPVPEIPGETAEIPAV